MLIVVLAAIFLSALSVQAGGKPEPVPSRQLTGIFDPDPKDVWRTITQTKATSDCIGSPVTPLCAADTFLACILRHQIDLCKKVGQQRMYFGPRYVSEEYYIVAQKTLREQDILERFKDAYWHRPGFVEMTVKSRSRLDNGGFYPAKGWDTYTYMLKPVDGRWHVVSSTKWGSENFVE